MRGGRRSATERLDAPRTWLPAWRARTLLRLGLVCVLLLTAAAALALDPGGERAAEHGQPPTATSGPCAATPGGPPHGTVGFPLRLSDPAVLAVVRAGQRVDILVRADPSDAAAGSAVRVAENLPVLRTVGTAGAPDGVLYLAASPQQAGDLASIEASAKISVTVRSPD